jgi:hypothetical protein
MGMRVCILTATTSGVDRPARVRTHSEMSGVGTELTRRRRWASTWERLRPRRFLTRATTTKSNQLEHNNQETYELETDVVER